MAMFDYKVYEELAEIKKLIKKESGAQMISKLMTKFGNEEEEGDENSEADKRADELMNDYSYDDGYENN